MDYTNLIIKLANGCEPEKYFIKSLNNKSGKYYYNINETSNGQINPQMIDKVYYVIAFKHHEGTIEYAYLGTGKLIFNNSKYSIILSIKSKLNYGPALRNICRLAELDLNEDYQKTEYLIVEESELISKQVEFIINEPYESGSKKQYYPEIDSENILSEFAQKNQYCERQYNLRPPMENRGEFQRDYERIVHSKSFRRMVDKAQVFSASKGDYYRTRMTHTQAVSQIARGISEGLRLNNYLVEAIALGHDIGHTPFGHQGERTLDNILHGKYSIIKNSKVFEETGCFGGFKHNYQSVRVASLLEEDYTEICGMDLSYQTLEGMLKHTSLKREKYNLDEFIADDNAKEKLYFNNDFCSTLEGQTVAIADEIAQRGHDLDDALSSGSMRFEDFQKYLTVKKFKGLADIVNNVTKNIDTNIELHRRYIDENELRNSLTVSAIVSYFINDVIDNSKKLLETYDISEFKDNNHRVTKELICFSKEAALLNGYLESIITSKVINSPEVSLFDNNASTIIKGLFEAYYNNPNLLHKGTQRKLYINLRKVSDNVVDFEFGNHEIIKEELYKIINEDISNPDLQEYKLKRHVLVRTICDYISGMTDTYAINEYNRIVK